MFLFKKASKNWDLRKRALGLFAVISLWETRLNAQQYLVSELVSDREFCLDTLGKPNPEAETLLAIISHETKDLLGYGMVLGHANNEDCPTQVLVKTHVSGVLMRPGNWVFQMDITSADTQIPGNFLLLVNDNRDASVRYKPRNANRHHHSLGKFLQHHASALGSHSNWSALQPHR